MKYVIVKYPGEMKERVLEYQYDTHAEALAFAKMCDSLMGDWDMEYLPSWDIMKVNEDGNLSSEV